MRRQPYLFTAAYGGTRCASVGGRDCAVGKAGMRLAIATARVVHKLHSRSTHYRPHSASAARARAHQGSGSTDGRCCGRGFRCEQPSSSWRCKEQVWNATGCSAAVLQFFCLRVQLPSSACPAPSCAMYAQHTLPCSRLLTCTAFRPPARRTACSRGCAGRDRGGECLPGSGAV